LAHTANALMYGMSPRCRRKATNGPSTGTIIKDDAALFVNNALDSRPLLSAERTDDPPLSVATTFRPRTIGVSASWRF
jgi:hypothetical protein